MLCQIEVSFLHTVLLHSSIYFFFIIAPFKNRFRYSLQKTLLLSCGYIIFVSFEFFFFTTLKPDFFLEIANSFLLMLFSIIFCKFLFKSNALIIIFSIFLVSNTKDNILIISGGLQDLGFFDTLLKYNTNSSNYVLIGFIVLIVLLPALYYICMILLKQAIELNISRVCWSYLYLIPVLYYIYTKIYGILFTDKMEMRTIIVIVLLNAIVYFFYIVTLKMLIKTHENLEINNKFTNAENLINIQKEEYEKLTENFKTTTRLWHDWKHHLITITGFVKENNLTALNTYLDNYCKNYLVKDDKISICQNHSVDILLRHYISLAKKNDVEVEIYANLPKDLSISDVDLNIIFGNLMQNALDACLNQKTGTKFIKVKSEIIGSQLMLLIQNSFDGYVRHEDNRFYSTSHEGEGIGIASVRNIVERYDGSLKISWSKNVFNTYVLLIL